MENKKLGYIVFKSILKPIGILLYRPKILNKKYIPKEGPVILCGNHTNIFDPLLVVSSTKRMVHFIAKKELHKGILSWFFKLSGTIPVDRNNKNENIRNIVKDVLDNNYVLGIFPEGTTLKKEGELLPFKKGAITFAKDNDATIVPFSITGKYTIFNNKLTICFEKPFKIKNESIEEGTENLYKIIKKSIDKNK